MKNELVNVLNLETGERGLIRRRLFESPVFNPDILVEVDPEQKPYVSELYKSKVESDLEDTDDSAESDEDEEEV